MLFWGNNHVLEFNEFYSVCTETGDAGAFYIGHDWSQRGNVISYNYFHDLAESLAGESGYDGITAVYLDDQVSGTTVFGNVFHRVSRGVLVGGGRDNVLGNNVFAFCGRATVPRTSAERQRSPLPARRARLLSSASPKAPVKTIPSSTRPAKASLRWPVLPS